MPKPREITLTIGTIGYMLEEKSYNGGHQLRAYSTRAEVLAYLGHVMDEEQAARAAHEARVAASMRQRSQPVPGVYGEPAPQSPGLPGPPRDDWHADGSCKGCGVALGDPHLPGCKHIMPSCVGCGEPMPGDHHPACTLGQD